MRVRIKSLVVLILLSTTFISIAEKDFRYYQYYTDNEDTEDRLQRNK